jgi:phosphatidate cytidylyltransferase
MLSTRVKAALVFVPLLLILIYLGGWVYNLFIIAVLIISAYEYGRIFEGMGYSPSIPILSVGVLLLALQRWLSLGFFGEILFPLVIFMTALAALITHESGGKEAAIHFAIHMSGILYVGFVGSFLISIRALPNGRGWLLTALPIVWLADSGAYFIGRWIGRHKLAPRLSPGKTWEGLGGAIAAATLSGTLLILLWRAVGFLPADTPLWQGTVMGLTVSILTPLGDLFISLLKRTAGMKDTGTLIPGHGGMLDRIDTWIWAALIGYFLVTLFQ